MLAIMDKVLPVPPRSKPHAERQNPYVAALPAFKSDKRTG